MKHSSFTPPVSRVVLYDPVALNPYGGEVAGLLARSSVDVRLLTSHDAPWVPDGPVVRRLLPGNLLRPKLLQLCSFTVGIASVLQAVLVSRRTLVAVWTRTALEDFLFAGLARLGFPVVVVAHNPSPRARVSKTRMLSQRVLTNSASTVVVHSERLENSFPAGTVPRRISRCCHPPFSTWAAQPIRVGSAPDDRNHKATILFLGSLRSDKGAELLPEVLRFLPAKQRERVLLLICGRGFLPSKLREELNALGLALEDRTSSEFVSDNDVRLALDQADVLLAPYVGATQSSTVAAALAMSLPVLAFDQGAIGEIVTDDGLVPSGDIQAMGLRLASALDGRTELGQPRVDATTWELKCQGDWLEVLETASGTGNTMRTARPPLSIKG